MKNSFFLFLIILTSTVSCEYSFKKSKEERLRDTMNFSALSLKVKLIRAYDASSARPGCAITDLPTDKRFDIKLTINNNTDSIISFWMMSCSWDDAFIINQKYLSLICKNCDKNIPKLIRIQKGDSLIFLTTLTGIIPPEIPLEASKTYRNIFETKVGLVLADENEIKNEADYFKFKGDKNLWTKVIWSNGLRLDM